MALDIHRLYPPITSEIGYLECSPEVASDSYVQWMQPLLAPRGASLQRHDVMGTFANKVLSLLPLVDIRSCRTLFLPTTSQWTGYLDNGWRGTDAFHVVSYLCQQIGCRGLRVVSIDDTIRKTPAGPRGRHGATALELYSPTAQPGSALNIQRSICAANDGGRWRFDAIGDPLRCENTDSYTARVVKDRFTDDALSNCLKYFGLDASPDIFETTSPASLVVENGPSIPGAKCFTLEEAQADA